MDRTPEPCMLQEGGANRRPTWTSLSGGSSLEFNGERVVTHAQRLRPHLWLQNSRWRGLYYDSLCDGRSPGHAFCMGSSDLRPSMPPAVAHTWHKIEVRIEVRRIV